MMSALGAFLRGVGGAGLIDQAQYMRRQQEIDQARLERQRELDESRKWREEQMQADRDARAARSGGGGGSRGGALADAAGAEAVDPLERQAVFREMQDTGVSMAEAQQRVADAKTGTNRFTKTSQVAEQIDDGDRMRTVTREQSEPDVESFKAMMKRLGRSLAGATSDLKSNADQLAGGRQTDAVTAGAFSGNPGQERGALLAQGKSPFDDGSSVLTGEAAPRSVANAKIASEGALTGKRNADARSSGSGGGAKAGVTVQRVITTENGDAVAVMRDGTTRNLGIRTPDFNKEVSRIAARMAKEDFAFSNLPPDEQRERATQAFLGSKPTAAAAPGAKPAAASAGLKPPPPAVLAKAKAALDAKAPRAAVLQRLKDAGYDTTGL